MWSVGDGSDQSNMAVNASNEYLGNIVSKTDVSRYTNGDAIGACFSVTGTRTTAGPRVVSAVVGTKNLD